MVLTTHAAIGGFIGAVAAQNPALAAVAGFSSHFIMDTIPHWDYKLSSTVVDKNDRLNTNMTIKGKAFFTDLIKIGFDFCLGIALVILLFYSESRVVLIGALIGAFCAILPDPLQFVYWKFKREPLISLQKFHANFMHARANLNNKPFLGILCQVAIIVLFAGLSFKFF
jgi:hypothetical protein